MSCPEALRALGSALAVAALAGAAGRAAAAEWDWSPRIELAGTANDNYRLTNDPGAEIEVAGALLDVSVDLHSATPRSTISIVPRARSTWFPSESGEDSNDQFLQASFNRKSPRATLELRGDAAREAVVRSELPDTHFGDPVLGVPEGVDTGVVTTHNRRELLQLSPRYGLQWTARTRLDLEASWLDVGFTRRDPAYVGFRQLRGLAGLGFAASPNATLRISGFATRYDPEVGTRDSMGYGLIAEWSNRLSPVAELYLRGGAERTEVDRPAILGSGTLADTTWLAAFGARWRLRVTDVFFDASRRIDPSASGFVLERNELRLRATRHLTPRVNGSVALRALETSAIDPAATYRDRRYATGSLGLEWRLRRAWSLLATYDHTWQEFDGSPRDAAANSASIGLVYEPRRTD